VSFFREVIATPGELADKLAALEPPDRAAEREQFEAAVAAAAALAPTVSKRESLSVTLIGHSDAEGEGFDARNVSVSLSRIEPEEAKRRAEEAARAAEEADAAAAAAAEKAQEAHAAAERAAEEAGEAPSA
jgi:hypothetical protein